MMRHTVHLGTLTVMIMCLIPSLLSATATPPATIVSRLREMNPFKKNTLKTPARLLLACTPLAAIALLLWRKQKHTTPTLSAPTGLALAPTTDTNHQPVGEIPRFFDAQKQPIIQEQITALIKVPTVDYSPIARTQLAKKPEATEFEQKLLNEVTHQLAAAELERQQVRLENAANDEKEGANTTTTTTIEEPCIEEEQRQTIATQDAQQAEIEEKKAIELESERRAAIVAQEAAQESVVRELAERQAQHNRIANEKATKLTSGFKMMIARKQYRDHHAAIAAEKERLAREQAKKEAELLRVAAEAAEAAALERRQIEQEKAARSLKAEQERRVQQMALFATRAKEWLARKQQERELAAHRRINEQATKLTYGFKTLIAQKKYKDRQAAIVAEKERLAREHAKKEAATAAALEQQRIEQEKNAAIEAERQHREAAITAEKERARAVAQAAAQAKERQRKEAEKAAQELKAEQERLAAIAAHEKEIQRQEAEKAKKEADVLTARQQQEAAEALATAECKRKEAAAIEVTRARERTEKALKQLRHQQKKADKKEHLRQIQEHIRQRLKSIENNEAMLNNFIEPYIPGRRELTTIELKALNTLFNEISRLEFKVITTTVASKLMPLALINARTSSKKTMLYHEVVANCMACITSPGTDLGEVLKSLPGYRTLYLEPSIREMVAVKAMLAKIVEFGPCLGLYYLAPEHLASIITANGVHLASTDANIRFPLAYEIEKLYLETIRAMPKEELLNLEPWLTVTKGLSRQQTTKRELHQPAIDRALKLIREEIVKRLNSEPVHALQKQEELV